MYNDVDATDSLRQQFQQLQEQHQKKLLLRKQRLSSTVTRRSEVSESKDSLGNGYGSFGDEIEDNLELKVG